MNGFKLLAETEEENLYICDGKNDRLYELCVRIIEIVKYWSRVS